MKEVYDGEGYLQKRNWSEYARRTRIHCSSNVSSVWRVYQSFVKCYTDDGRGGVMDVRISLHGCDDATYIDTDVTAEEYDFLRKLERLSKENSDYPCQPILDVKRKDAENDTEN